MAKLDNSEELFADLNYWESELEDFEAQYKKCKCEIKKAELKKEIIKCENNIENITLFLDVVEDEDIY